MSHSLIDSDFTATIKEEFKIFNNFAIIVDKLDSDGCLPVLLNAIEVVFKNEMGFALSGILIRAQED